MESMVSDVTRQAAFNAAYWASQSPAVVAASKIPDFSQRGIALTALAESGSIVDKAIMWWGWDPYGTMLFRWVTGYTWVPNLNQPMNSPPPGFALPGQIPYDPQHPPSGSILVHDPNNFDLTVWFPPFFKPQPTPQPGTVPLVDLNRPWREINGWYSTLAGYYVPDGQTRTDVDGKAYTKVIMQWPFGDYHGWKLAQ